MPVMPLLVRPTWSAPAGSVSVTCVCAASAQTLQAASLGCLPCCMRTTTRRAVVIFTGSFPVLGCSVAASLGPSAALMKASAAGASLSDLHTCYL